MLIVTRHAQESIHIQNSIVVTILRVKGSYVRIGITAPLNVSVNRSEVYQRMPIKPMAPLTADYLPDATIELKNTETGESIVVPHSIGRHVRAMLDL